MKQIELPPPERHVRWITPVLLLFSLACIGGLVAILLSDVTAPFVGPWG